MPTSLTGVRAVRGVNVLPINKQNKTNISMRKNKTKQKKRSIDNIIQAIRYGMGSRHVFTSFPNMNLLIFVLISPNAKKLRKNAFLDQ